jgi:hypothetical protein
MRCRFSPVLPKSTPGRGRRAIAGRTPGCGLGPGFVLPSGTDTSVLLDRVEPLIAHGVRGLLYHRRSSGAWAWRTYVDTAPSPSKTALCLMAVAGSAGCLGAGDLFDPARDIPLEAKYVQRLNQAVSGAFGGAGVRLVVPWPPGRGSGYALAVPASGTEPDGEA